jgi:NTE family protein
VAFRAPDVLVLGGGGTLGEVWMNAVLAGIEDVTDFDARKCEDYVGTSAGSIVAAALVGGARPDARLGALPEPLAEEAEAMGGQMPGVAIRAFETGVAAAVAPVASIALGTMAPGGAAVRRLALGRLPRGTRSLGGIARAFDSRGVRFDGRLAISAVDLDSGRRVMFGRPGAPSVSVGRAVEASCAIPGYFHPVSIGGRDYVDGGAWSPTNMDTAKVSRGTRVLCLNPTGSMSRSLMTAMGAIGLASRSLARVEALVLEGRGASVETVSPDAGSLEAIGPNLMDPRPRERVIAAGVEQGRRIGRG